MDVDPQGMILLQHIGELVGYAHGQEHRHARADADDLDMGDLAQPAEDLFQDARGQHQRVAAGEQHVAHLRRALEVFDLQVELFAREGCRWIADDARARAVAAIGCALGGDQHQHPVRVAMHQPRNRRVAVFRQRILHHGSEWHHLPCGGDHLLADWIVRIVRIDQRNEVGRDIHAKQVRCRERFPLAVGERDNLFKLLGGVDPVAELPAPVVPFLVRHIGVERRSFRKKRGVHRSYLLRS